MPDSIVIEILTKQDCCLCDEAKAAAAEQRQQAAIATDLRLEQALADIPTMSDEALAAAIEQSSLKDMEIPTDRVRGDPVLCKEVARAIALTTKSPPEVAAA